MIKGVEEHMSFVNVNRMVHIRQRIIANCLKAFSYKTVLVKCRKTVSHFRHSPLQNAKLSKACTQLNIKHVNLVQDVITSC